MSKLFGGCRVVWTDALALVKSTPAGGAGPDSAELQKICITQAKQTDGAGWYFLSVSRWKPTSQVCSWCGDRWGTLLSVRSVLCLHCGADHDRDINTSVYILAAGLADLNGQTLSRVRPPSGAVACLSTRQESA